MKYLTLFGILLLAVLFGNSVDCIKVKQKIKKPTDFAEIRRTHINKIKIVHYAFKENDGIKIKSMPVKVLGIAEPFHDWVAKSLWTGDNYNTTG